MRKYRIIERAGRYQPQYKDLILWKPLCDNDPTIWFSSQKEAKKIIDNNSRTYKKIKSKRKVVFSS